VPVNAKGRVGSLSVPGPWGRLGHRGPAQVARTVGASLYLNLTPTGRRSRRTFNGKLRAQFLWGGPGPGGNFNVGTTQSARDLPSESSCRRQPRRRQLPRPVPVSEPAAELPMHLPVAVPVAGPGPGPVCRGPGGHSLAGWQATNSPGAGRRESPPRDPGAGLPLPACQCPCRRQRPGPGPGRGRSWGALRAGSLGPAHDGTGRAAAALTATCQCQWQPDQPQTALSTALEATPGPSQATATAHGTGMPLAT
jgi:hypothetical protein